MALEGRLDTVVSYALYVWEAEPAAALRFIWDEGTKRWQCRRVQSSGDARGPVKSSWQLVVWEGNFAKFRGDYRIGLGELVEKTLDDIRKATN